MDLMDVTLTRINKQTAEDPYASMEKDQLISMIHFPMTVERKNSLTFGSHDGAEVSVIYHTFIETCRKLL